MDSAWFFVSVNISRKRKIILFFDKLNSYFKSKVKVPRIRVGKNQEIETLFNEEAYLFAKYLRIERKE